MKVLLLAAGRSKRMKPIEDKNFLNFLGKPLIQHQLETLQKAGFKDVLVVGGAHNLNKIKQLGNVVGLNIEICEQKDLDLGMAGAVMAAKEHLGQEPVLVCSSNDMVDREAFELIQKAYEKGDGDGYILAKKVEKYFPGGYLQVADDGLIKNIVEKPEPGTEPSDLINLVVHVHKNPGKLIEYLEKIESDKDDLYERALMAMINDDVSFKTAEYSGFWQPIKYPWHVYPVFRYLFEKADKKVDESVQISEKASIKGEVIIGENVKIFDGAVVSGPCYIGSNTVIANNALVRDCNIGSDCVIGFCSEVARSYLGNEVWSHTNYIGDSVIGNNVSFGAGAVTGNLRLDEENVVVDYDGVKVDSGTEKFGCVVGDNVRVGVNSSIMPGVKIGGGSFIGSGIVVGQNIDENSFVRGDWSLKISENKANVSGDRESFKKKLH